MMTNENNALPVDADTPELIAYIAYAQKVYDDYMLRNGYTGPAHPVAKIEFSVGPKYVRVLRQEYYRDEPTRKLSGSAHSFIDRTNGNILKPDGWKRPAKGVRGNIFDQPSVERCVNQYGAR